MFRSRKSSLLTAREGCGANLEIVLEGANSDVFSKQKAALTALDKLCEERCLSALIFIMKEFYGSDNHLKQHLAKKAMQYLKREQP